MENNKQKQYTEKQSSMLENLKKFLDSPEGQKAINDFQNEQHQLSEFFARWRDKCIDLIKDLDSDSLSELFEKFDKHNEKKKSFYRESELCDVILETFRVLGTEIPEDEFEMFTSEMFEYKGYIAELVVGQGAFIDIYRKGKNNV